MTSRTFLTLLALHALAAGAAFRADPLGSMTSPRAAHTATLLADGTVLITGGCTVHGCTDRSASAERFDPVSGLFTALGPMAKGRSGHTAVRLHDGRVLIAGGWNERAVTASAELFDPATGLFTSAGDMHSPRASHLALLLDDGRVLLVGGERANQMAVGSAELYDPQSGKFLGTGSMVFPRMSHAAVVLADGRVLVVGGRRDRDVVLDSTEIYDPNGRRFVLAASMGKARQKIGIARLQDGRVLVVGGSDSDAAGARHFSTEIFDPKFEAFLPGPKLAQPRYKIGGATLTLPSGEVLVAGGADDAAVLDPAGANAEQVEGAITGANSFSTATLLADGRVLVLGGYSASLRVTAGAWVIARR